MRHGYELIRADVVAEHAYPQRWVRLVLKVLVQTADLGTVLFLGFRAESVVGGCLDGHGFGDDVARRFG